MADKNRRSSHSSVSRGFGKQTAQTLRRQAEDIAGREKSLFLESIGVLSSEEIRHMFHEFRVNQIELKMQNEELRRMQEELDRARASYFDLYDLAPVAYCTISEKGLIQEANFTAATLLGVARGALATQPISRFVHNDDQDLYYRHRKRLFETGNPQMIELRMLPHDGAPFWANLVATAVQDTDGFPVCRIVMSDITERKRAEAALRESEMKYRSMMEAMKDAACICSPELKIEYMNPRMLSRIGRDATGEYCYKAIYDRDERCSRCVFDKVSQGEHVDYELADPKNGRFYSITGSPVYHSDATISKLLIFRDITDVKAIEAQLYQTRKMESIGTMAGGIAHDFNNILYIITGNAELAMQDIPKGNPVYENLKEIKSAGLRAAGIVQHLLNFSRQTKQRPKPIGAVKVIQDALKFLRSTIPSSIEMQTHLPDAETTILGDPTQINQVMMNLCINASQAMENAGGVLEIAVEQVRFADNALKRFVGLSPGQYLKIRVSDNGPGIKPEIAERIFDPYFTTKDVGKGSGLGLSVVHGIVKNHHGAIDVDSEPGKGATFTLLFPVAGEKSGEEGTGPDKIPRGQGEKILFVDDELSIANMAGSTLQRLGYTVQTATSPVEALALFEPRPEAFDLVVTDMTMPRMNGVQLSEKLKAIRPALPVLLCTGHSSLVDAKTAASKGIAGYVMKPIVTRDMARAIRRVLEKKGAKPEG